jgi:membrane carboxypeptidase/penicillin-binding protein PbpC
MRLPRVTVPAHRTTVGASLALGLGNDWIEGKALKRLTITLLTLAILLSLAGGILFAVTPSVVDARQIASRLVNSHDGTGLGTPPPSRFVQSLVATEDQRFFWAMDPGVDPAALARVAYGTIIGLHGDLGGSTITQQLAKMLYFPHRHDLVATVEQVTLAIKLHFAFSRQEILTMYADVAYFGDGYYGLAAASCGYFGKPPADLGWAQAATLAGAVNAPSADDPRTHGAQARSRATHVFDRLVAVGVLTRAQADAALAVPLNLAPRHVCSLK